MQYSIIKFVRKWLKQIDKEDITGIVFFNLGKEFDAIDHDTKKLNSHKFDDRTMDRMKTYTTNRSQCIVSATSSF